MVAPTMKCLDSHMRRIFLIYGAIALLIVQAQVWAQPSTDYKYSPPAKLNDGIQTGTLMSAKLDEAKVSAGMNEVLKRTYGNIHSVLIFRNGKLVCEEYFTGPDENNHKGGIGVVAHDRETLHDLRSITKSVVALSVLIAHSQGRIKDLDQSIFDFFPEYASYAEGEKKNITVRHALTMTPGLEWSEAFSYSNPANTAYQMNRAPDTIGFVLGRKLVNKPGTKFEYSGGTTQLLAAIIKKTTGSNIEEFTRRQLLAPLGITKYEWAELKPGEPDADSGLRLRSRDLAKIGLLLVNGGMWNGKRIVPEKLIAEAMAEHAKVSSDEKTGDVVTYGYQMWRFAFPPDDNWPSGFIELSGNGGQKVYIDPKTKVMVVVTAANYDLQDLKKSSFDIYPDIVFPALLDRVIPKGSAVGREGDSVSIRLGHAKMIEDGKITIKFLSIVEDSRCPMNAQCVWAGNARIRLSLVKGRSLRSFELNTGTGVKTVSAFGYSFEIEDLTPWPGAPPEMAPQPKTVKFAVTKL